MKLFIVEATYDTDRAINNPFNFYVIAEDSFEASDKISKAISDSPKEMKNWYLKHDPEILASNECCEDYDLLIESV